MPRLSKLLEKLEDTVEARWGVWFQRHKKKLPLYIPVGLVCWYFYGMLLNSMRLGTDAIFHNTGQDVTAIWIFDPIRNWLAIFSGFGLKATAFFALMFCLVTKRGYFDCVLNKAFNRKEVFSITPPPTLYRFLSDQSHIILGLCIHGDSNSEITSLKAEITMDVSDQIGRCIAKKIKFSVTRIDKELRLTSSESE